MDFWRAPAVEGVDGHQRGWDAVDEDAQTRRRAGVRVFDTQSSMEDCGGNEVRRGRSRSA
jgi:hypothetical protein